MDGIRAIARIDLGDKSFGTGFLISSELGLVMTAFHVIAHRKESLAKGAPIWRKAPIAMTFGDPNNPPDQWTATGEPHVPHFSMEHDWAIVKIAPVDNGVVPLRLAKYTFRAGTEFSTFGFPTMRASVGAVLTGGVLRWNPNKCEVDAQQLDAEAKGGENAGGISGAPVVIDGAVAGIVVQVLSNAQGQAVTRSLWVKPIELAVKSFVGLVEWDDQEPIALQTVVEGKLPGDHRIEDAARLLKLPGARTRTPVARRLLGTRLEAAWPAINACNLEARDAGPIIDSIAAMEFTDEAMTGIRTACLESDPVRIPILGKVRPIVYRWHVQRAFDIPNIPVPRNRIVVLVSKSIDAESVTFDKIVAKVRERLTKGGNRPEVLDTLFAAKPHPRIRAWLVLINEVRPDLLQELRDKFPNIRTIAAVAEPKPFPAPFETLGLPIAPRLDEGEVNDLILSWADAASQLDVPDEIESDDL